MHIPLYTIKFEYFSRLAFEAFKRDLWAFPIIKLKAAAYGPRDGILVSSF